jgi:toxin FitB
MIVLDTNVLSALMLNEPEQGVLAWLNALEPSHIWIPAISVLESRSGVLRLPEGRRKVAMTASLNALLEDVVSGRILPFDAAAAESAAAVATRRIAAGLNIDTLDTQIAGICLSRKATLATRNIRHFRDLGIPLVNPWNAAA